MPPNKSNSTPKILFGIIALFLLTLIISASILFFIFKSLRLQFGGVIFILIGIWVLCNLKNNYLKKDYDLYLLLGGFALLTWGIVVLLLRWDLAYSLALLITMTILSFFVIPKLDILLGTLFSSVYIFAAFTLISPLSLDFLNTLFLIEIPTKNIILLILGAGFIILSFYFFIERIFTLLLKFGVDKKLRSPYFILSITLILVIVLAGISGVRQYYRNDFPFSITLANSPIFEGNIFDCQSTSGNIYFLDKDKIHCNANLNLAEGYQFDSLESGFHTSKDGLGWNLYSKDGYHLELENNSLKSLGLILDKEYKEYQLFLNYFNSSNAGSKSILISHVIPVHILNEEEYENKILKRIGLVVAILTLALFSVFSAMANLKKILEKEN